MQAEAKNKRREERVSTSLPVDLSGTSGITRDVSASGVFFEVGASYALGNTVSFAVQLVTPAGPMTMRCRGEIVRIEPRGQQVGVAVKITESTMVEADK